MTDEIRDAMLDGCHNPEGLMEWLEAHPEAATEPMGVDPVEAIAAEEYAGLVLDGLTGPVQSDRDVEIVLKRMQRHNRRITDIQTRVNVEIAQIREEAETRIRELQERADAMQKPHTSALAWLDGQFREPVRQWCHAFLVETGAKKKSVKTLFGTVGFKTSRTSRVVADLEAALDWCRVYAQEAIKSTVLVSKLPPGADVPGVVIEGGEEAFYMEAD